MIQFIIKFACHWIIKNKYILLLHFGTVKQIIRDNFSTFIFVFRKEDRIILNRQINKLKCFATVAWTRKVVIWKPHIFNRSMFCPYFEINVAILRTKQNAI